MSPNEKPPSKKDSRHSEIIIDLSKEGLPRREFTVEERLYKIVLEAFNELESGNKTRVIIELNSLPVLSPNQKRYFDNLIQEQFPSQFYHKITYNQEKAIVVTKKHPLSPDASS